MNINTVMDNVTKGVEGSLKFTNSNIASDINNTTQKF